MSHRTTSAPGATSAAARRTGRPRARTTLVLTAAAAVVLGLLPAAVLPAPAAQAASGARAITSDFDRQVLYWTNVERKKRGIRPLKATTCPDRFARAHVRRMAARDRMYHQALRPVLRECRARTAGENVAWGGSRLTARKVVRMWMGSPGHRRNLLAGKYRHLGVDAWRSAETGRVYVGQVFKG